MIRNNRVSTYSSRLVSEFKTFVWTGSKAQAQRGKNDDLVMSLAIGLWLYDSSSKKVKKSMDMNTAMLAAFGVNKREDSPTPRNRHASNLSYLARKGMPVMLDESHPAISGSLDFKWVL